MDARFALSSLSPIALVARLFRRRTSRYHMLVDAVVRVAVVVDRLVAGCCCLLDCCDCSSDFAARVFFPLLDLPLFVRPFAFVLEFRTCSARGVLPATGGSFIGAFPCRALTILPSILRVS